MIAGITNLSVAVAALSTVLVGAVASLPLGRSSAAPTAPASLPGIPDLSWVDRAPPEVDRLAPPPFSRLRQPVAARAAAPPAHAIAAREDGIALRGIFIAGDRRTALVITASDAEPRWVGIGDRLGGEEILQIAPDRIALGRDGRQRILTLTPDTPPEGEPQ